MKTAAVIVLVGWAIAASAQVKILDDFSADSSASYNKVTPYSPGGGTASYARNGSDQFEPTWNGEATVHWYWLGGQKLRVGDSVSVEFMLNTVGAFTAAGIALATNSAEGGVNMYVIWRLNVGQFWALDYDDPDYITGIGTQTGMSTITVTRVSGSVFDWTVRGGGLTVDNSYTNTAWSGVEGIYFGIMGYRGNNGTAGVFDNLGYHHPPAGTIFKLQ